MARKLQFNANGQIFDFAIQKVDRDKLYGWREIKATSPTHAPLQKAYLDEWGSVVIASVGMGYLDEARCWHTKNDLIAVDASGKTLETLPSSFDEAIPLGEVVDYATYLEHEAMMVYTLKGFQTAEFARYLAGLSGIYCFPFRYRASYDARPTFLIPVDDVVFMVITAPTDLVFVSKPMRAELDEEDPQEEEDDTEDLDFGLM